MFSRPLFVALSVVILAVAGAPSRAFAAPADITVDITAAGLSAVATAAKASIPKDVTWPSYSSDKVKCPWSSSKTAKISLTAGKAKVDVSSVAIRADQGQIVADIAGRIPSGGITASFSICIGGTNTCRVEFSASTLRATARFTPRIVGGELTLAAPALSVNIPDSGVKVSVTQCNLAALANPIITEVKGWLIDQLDKWVETEAVAKTRPLIEKALRGITGYKGQIAGVNVAPALSSISASNGGLRVTGGLKVSAATPATGYCAPGTAPTLAPPSTAVTIGAHAEHIAMAVSARTLRQALVATWQTGWFCFDDARMKSLGFDKLAGAAGALLAIPAVTGIRAKASTAPTLEPVGTGGEIKLTAPFQVDISSDKADGGKPATLSVSAPITMRGALVVDPITRGVRFDIQRVETATPTITASSDAVRLPAAAAVKAAIDSLVLPSIKSTLGALALLPQVLTSQNGGALDGNYLIIKRRESSGEHFKLYADLFTKPERDVNAPTTAIAEKPKMLVAAGKVELVATGTDSQTPRELLRYRWRVNGGEWSAPSFAPSNVMQLPDGLHRVEVKAVDLNGNEDPTPEVAYVEVDSVAPEVAFAQAPSGVIKASTIVAVAAARDNRDAASDIAVRMLLERVDTSKPMIVRDEPFIRGATRFEVRALVGGDYVMTLIARDKAGNISKTTQARFTIEAPAGPGGPGGDDPDGAANAGGCAAAGGGAATSGAALPAWLALLGLLVIRRRSRR